MDTRTHASDPTSPPAPIDNQAIDRLIVRGCGELEPIRFSWLIAYLSAWAAGLIGVGICRSLYLDAPDATEVWGTAIGVTVFVVLVLAGISANRQTLLHNAFDDWRAEIVRTLDATATILANHHIGEDEFDGSGLNSQQYNRYSGSSYLTVGSLRASNLAVDDVQTETYYETVYETDSDGRSSSRQVSRTRTVVVPVFHGMMFVAPAPLPCPGRILLNTADHGIGRLRSFTVASPHLNRHYTMGADDPFAGHRTLTPVIQEAIWRFRGRFREIPRLSYMDGLLYIAIPGVTLECGNRPNRWFPVTVSRLRRVVELCDAAILFLRTATTELVPETI